MRRLAILFADLVGSTSLSTRIDTESYRRIVRRYHRECEHAITDHGGRVARKTGDGILAFFGHPTSHEDDTARAVRAALAIVRRIAAVRPDIEREFGETIDVRAAVHLGPVHLDLIDSEIYGLAPNLAARLQDLAEPNTVAVSDAVVLAMQPAEERAVDRATSAIDRRKCTDTHTGSSLVSTTMPPRTA